jgi:hypothetical protein
MVMMKFPNADLSHYQDAINNAAEDELIRYSLKVAISQTVQEVFAS